MAATRSRVLLASMLASGGAMVVGGALLPASAAPLTETFLTDTTFVVPEGVSCITVTAAGGIGGAGGPAGDGGGGDAGQITASFAVTPAEPLPIVIGQPGGDGVANDVNVDAAAGGLGGQGHTDGGDGGDTISDT